MSSQVRSQPAGFDLAGLCFSVALFALVVWIQCSLWSVGYRSLVFGSISIGLVLNAVGVVRLLRDMEVGEFMWCSVGLAVWIAPGSILLHL